MSRDTHYLWYRFQMHAKEAHDVCALFIQLSFCISGSDWRVSSFIKQYLKQLKAELKALECKYVEW